MSMTFEELETRVVNGMAWLAAHDQNGAFHLWFQSGLTAHTPLPAQGEAVREEWQRYYKQRLIWEQLDAQLLAMEAQRART